MSYLIDDNSQTDCEVGSEGWRCTIEPEYSGEIWGVCNNYGHCIAQAEGMIRWEYYQSWALLYSLVFQVESVQVHHGTYYSVKYLATSTCMLFILTKSIYVLIKSKKRIEPNITHFLFLLDFKHF